VKSSGGNGFSGGGLGKSSGGNGFSTADLGNPLLEIAFPVRDL